MRNQTAARKGISTARAFFLAGLATSLAFSAPVFADTAPLPTSGELTDTHAKLIPEVVSAPPFELTKIGGGKLALPWAIAFLPDGRILVTERAGKIRIVENGRLSKQTITGVPQVLTGGHSGLLDLVLDPNYASNKIVYLSHMHGSPDAATIRVVRATLDGTKLIDKQVIFSSFPAIKGVDQIGGRLAFGPDGCLYLTIGDRMQRERAQNLMDHSGTIVRFRADGSIPDDNPFAGRSDALPEIYTYGHRNPQGLTIGSTDGRLWAIEHGPYGGDELNLITPGTNYGWPVVTFGIDYDGSKISDLSSAPGLADPIHTWVPSVAPSSLISLAGDSPLSGGHAGFLLGSLSGESLIRLHLNGGTIIKEQRFLQSKIGRIRDVAQSPDGTIYLLTDGTEASLYRLEPLSDDIASKPTPPPRRSPVEKRRRG